MSNILSVEPVIIEVYLYNQNYKDRKIISALRNNAFIFNLPETDDNSFFVQCSDAKNILENKFGKDIKNLQTLPESSLSKIVTSDYFLSNIIQQFRKLRYIKVNVCDSSKYTRLSNNIITFDYKIIYARLDLPAMVEEDFLIEIQDLFVELGIYDPSLDVPYITMPSVNLFDTIMNYMDENKDNVDIASLCEDVLAVLGEKMQQDNTSMLIILKK